MTTRRRHTPEQVVRKLAQADQMLAEGKDVADVCRRLQVSEQTYYRWRNQFGGLKAEGNTATGPVSGAASSKRTTMGTAESSRIRIREGRSGIYAHSTERTVRRNAALRRD